MTDAPTPPLVNRLHRLASRLSEQGGFIVAQADVVKAVARIVQLERALDALLDHIGQAEYFDAGGCRLGEGTPVVSGARTLLGKAQSPAQRAIYARPAAPIICSAASASVPVNR